MKKNYSVFSILMLAVVLSSCKAFNYQKDTKTEANALISNALSGNTSQTTTDLLGRVLSYLLFGNTTSKESIIGTWTYSSPKVIFESENILAKVGSDIASEKVEKTLGEQLEHLGFTLGKTALTFNEDNTCSFTFGSRTYPGTYKYDSSTNRLTISDAMGVSNLRCTACKNGNELYLLFDSDKLLTLINTLGKSTISNTSAASVLNSYKGLKLGWSMTK